MPPSSASPLVAVQTVDRAPLGSDRYHGEGFNGREPKLVELKKFLGKKGGEVYK